MLRTPRNDDVEKAKDKAWIESFHREICKMGTESFPELCFSSVGDTSGNSIVVITQCTVMFQPPFGYTLQIQVTITGFQYEVHVMMKKWRSGVLESVADV